MAPTTKTELRRHFLDLRNRLEPPQIERDSAAITARLSDLPLWAGASTILIYVAFGSEVQTRSLLERGLRDGKRIVVPIVDRQSRETTLSELAAFEDLAPGAYPSILEPRPERRKLVEPSEIEVALVPGVAFDRKGGRLGMGAGYFDRLLKRMPNAVRVGLAFGAQLSSELLPAEPHDEAMHVLVTETETIEARPIAETQGPGGI